MDKAPHGSERSSRHGSRTGPETRAVFRQLERYESRNILYRDPDGRWPVVWKKARGWKVQDAEGRWYVDMTAAFGVAAAGHAARPVVAAGRRQMGELLHAMGDVHPHALKARLARELSRWVFERPSRRQGKPGQEGKTLFGSSGFEAVEAALKTALLATGRAGVIAFEGAYHGVGYGAVNATEREHFRGPFRSQIKEFASFVPYPACGMSSCRVSCRGGRCPGLEAVVPAMDAAARERAVGAVLVEPVQARGGIRVPHPRLLRVLRDWCDAHGALLVVDEIYTGFGRTGFDMGFEAGGILPDVVCVGKALTGGFPLSACVGRSDVMDRAWPQSNGEAIHTSTFLGHPVGCAMALAQLEHLDAIGATRQSAWSGDLLLGCLQRQVAAFTGPWRLEARGLGLMVGLEIRDSWGRPATRVVLELIQRLLERGLLFLPEGEHANVLGWTPPLVTPEKVLLRSVDVVMELLRDMSREEWTQEGVQGRVDAVTSASAGRRRLSGVRSPRERGRS